MGAPEGYVALDLVGFTDKGDYNANTVYMKNDLAHHLNDVWCSLKDNMSGTAPAQGDNWKIFVHGANTAAGMTAVDTSGLVGGEGQVVIAQELLDVISDAVLNKLVTKTMMSGVQINSADMVPTSALAYAMQEQITKLNSELDNTVLYCPVISSDTVTIKLDDNIPYLMIIGHRGYDILSGSVGIYTIGGKVTDNHYVTEKLIECTYISSITYSNESSNVNMTIAFKEANNYGVSLLRLK